MKRSVNLRKKPGSRPTNANAQPAFIDEPAAPPDEPDGFRSNDAHPPADFIVGALLYSIFASGRGEAVIALLPDEK